MSKTPEAKVRDPVVRWAKEHGIGHQRMSFRVGVKQAFPDAKGTDWCGEYQRASTTQLAERNK